MDRKILIGLKIKEIRKKSNLTQEQFSEKIGIEPPSLSNIENGKSFPSMQTVLRILEEFHITPKDFFDNFYYDNEKELEKQMFEIIQNQPIEQKRILYRIIKSFDI